MVHLFVWKWGGRAFHKWLFFHGGQRWYAIKFGVPNFLETRHPGIKKKDTTRVVGLNQNFSALFFQTLPGFLPLWKSHVQMVDFHDFSWFFMIFHGFHWLPFSISPFFSRTGQKLSSRGVACGLMAGALALCRRRRCQRAPVDVADVSISTAAAMRSWGVFMASTSLLYGIIDLDGFSDNIRHFCSWLDMPLIDFVSYTHEIRWIYRWLWHQVVPSWDGTVTASQISKNQGYHETEHEAMNRPKQLKLGLALFGRWFFLQTSGNKSRWGNLEGDEENGKTKLIETKQTRHHGDLGQLDFRFKCLQKLGKSTRFDLSKTCPPYFQLWNIKQMKAGFRST